MTYPLQAQGHSVDFPIIVPKYSHFPRLYSHFPHFQQIWQPEELREAFPRPSLPADRDRVSASESACGQGPCFRVQVCLRAGTVFPRPSLPAGRDFGPVRTCGAFPPAAARQVPPVHEATGGYAVRSPCPSGIPRPRHKALSMVLQRFLSLVLKRFLSLVLHRFLISGPDLRIDAGFCLFMPFCVH